jgi:hypothetical protein
MIVPRSTLPELPLSAACRTVWVTRGALNYQKRIAMFGFRMSGGLSRAPWIMTDENASLPDPHWASRRAPASLRGLGKTFRSPISFDTAIDAQDCR